MKLLGVLTRCGVRARGGRSEALPALRRSVFLPGALITRRPAIANRLDDRPRGDPATFRDASARLVTPCRIESL